MQERKEQWRTALAQHEALGETKYLGYIANEEEFKAALELLGQAEVVSPDVGGYSYESLSGEVLNRDGDHLLFEGEKTPLDIIGQLGDVGLGLEFVNDFKIRLALWRTERSLTVIDFESHEEPMVCEDCATSEDEDVRLERETNQYYSCEHFEGQYEYSFRYMVTLMSAHKNEKAAVLDEMHQIW